MTPELNLEAHRVPAGAEVVTPSICGNCTRQLYVKKGEKRLCTNCAAIVGHDVQVWLCTVCGTARKWGNGMPLDENGVQVTRPAAAYLKCLRCYPGSRRPTKHEFFEVSRGCA